MLSGAGFAEEGEPPKTPPKKGLRLIPAKSVARKTPIPIPHGNVPRVCIASNKVRGRSAYESEGRRFESCRARFKRRHLRAIPV